MRLRMLFAALAVSLLAACAHSPFGSARGASAAGVDHVLIWSRDGEAATGVLRERLGFTVRDADQHPDGVSTRVMRFADHSYLELFFIADRERARTQAPTEIAFLDWTYGPSNFGLETGDLDAALARASAAGLAGQTVDEPHWRTAGFEQGRVPGEPFFIQYRDPGAAEERGAVHANGARRLTAVWVAVPDLEAAGTVYRDLGLTRQRPVALPLLNARGLRVDAGDSAVLLVQPVGPGLAQAALEWPGHRVFGVSVEVADLGRTRAVLGTGGHFAYRGPFGRSLLADTRRDLGLYVEFHARR